MAKREELIMRMGNLEKFIYDKDLQIGHDACLWKCKDNKNVCPFGEEHTKEHCMMCTDEFLNVGTGGL